MAVSTEHTKDILMGDGVNTKFPFTFQVIEPEQVKCLKVLASGEEVELLKAEFEVRLINDGAGGGEVTYPLVGAPLETGDKLVIHRRTEIKQDYTPPNGQSFDAVAIRAEIDRLTMQNQEQEESLGRSVQTSMGSGADPKEYLNNVNEMLANARKLEELAVQETEKNLKDVKEQVEIATNEAISSEKSANNAAFSAETAANVVNGFDEYATEKQEHFNANANEQISAFNAASEENINKSRIWATGEDIEVETLEAGEHSSRIYASMAKASEAATKEASEKANVAATKLNEIDTVVDGAKAEITTVVEDSIASIDVAAKTGVSTVETAATMAGEAIAAYQQPIVPIEATSGTMVLETTKIYSVTIDGAVEFILPEVVNTGYFNQIKVMMNVAGTPTIGWGTTQFFNKATPEIEAGSYDVYFDYDNLLCAWVCGAMPKGAAS